MVAGEACHFCAACGAHNAIFVPPAACKRRPRQGTWSSSAHFYRALFYQRRTYIIYLPRLQLQHVIFCTVPNAIFATPAACKTTTSTRYVIFNCHFFLVFLINAQPSDACAMCHVIGAASRFLRRLRRAVTTQNAICCMLAAIDLAAGHSGGSSSSSRRSRRRQQTD